MTAVAFRSATDLLAGLERREFSSRELLELYLTRAERFNPLLNAIVGLDAERARKRAGMADAARARGEHWGPLHGLPMTVKDCFETAGLRTTAGAEALADHVPSRNALAVQRLLDAGAIVFGKTNTPAWAMDWQTHNTLHGTTRNPWDPDRTPGGSSGGAAAALAAGLTGLELGSDIGGSIRIPSHCCGVFGHKPSWGIVPQRGHVPGLPGTLVEADINVVGPLARGCADLALALGVLAGPPPDRALAWRLELPPPRQSELRDYRVAAWLDDADFPVDHSVGECLNAVVKTLRGVGVTVTDVRPPVELGAVVELYRQLLAPITSSTLTDEQFATITGLGSGAPEGEEVATFARAIGIRHREWLALHDQRERLRGVWSDFFRDYDVLVCPIAPLPAIPHDHSEPQLLRKILVNGEPRPYTDHFGWSGSFGVVHLPATAVPVGRSAGGLPVGLQIVAPYLEDRTALDFAQRLGREVGGFEPPPGFEAAAEL